MGFALGIGTKDRGHLNRAVPAISILTLLSKPNSQLTAAYYYKAAGARGRDRRRSIRSTGV